MASTEQARVAGFGSHEMPTAKRSQPLMPSRVIGGGRVDSAPSNGRAAIGLRRTFQSLLFGETELEINVMGGQEPGFFSDLNLDKLVGAITARRQAYDLAPYFYAPPADLETILSRQEIFEDLERPEIRALADAFAHQELVAHYRYQRQALGRNEGQFGHFHVARGFLNSVLVYCDTIERLAAALGEAQVRARGLQSLHEYLDGYIAGPGFGGLRDEARELDRELDGVRYTFLLSGSRITVGPYDDEQPDYSEQVSTTFERFRQGAVRSYLPELSDREAYAGIGVLHLVSKLYPRLFARLDEFCRRHADYLDETVALFDRELEFFLGYLEYIDPLRKAGLHFSYPRLSEADRAEQALETFDLVLAADRVPDGAKVVCNDVTLGGRERALVITGPNNGGKTTLARTIGQLHHLARLGCPVPGRDVRLFVCDQIFTRFERREDVSRLEGKLQDELNAMRDALESATPASLFVLNEMFNSTTIQDALFLGRRILEQISELDALCVCVTFLDELSTLDEKTVSMVAGVEPDDPAVRTYRLVRRPADGRAYARALAEKHGLTYSQLSERRPS